MFVNNMELNGFSLKIYFVASLNSNGESYKNIHLSVDLFAFQ